MKKYFVINEYQKSTLEPIILNVGELVSCLNESDPLGDWPDWILCRNNEHEGWVPKQIIEYTGEKGIIIEDYNAVEFDLVSGEIIVAEKELNGWIWGFKEGSSEIKAWAPLNALEPVERTWNIFM